MIDAFGATESETGDKQQGGTAAFDTTPAHTNFKISIREASTEAPGNGPGNPESVSKLSSRRPGTGPGFERPGRYPVKVP